MFVVSLGMYHMQSLSKFEFALLGRAHDSGVLQSATHQPGSPGPTQFSSVCAVSAVLLLTPLDCLLVLSRFCALLNPQCSHGVNTFQQCLGCEYDAQTRNAGTNLNALHVVV
jgi:hypothetical protein